MRLKAIYSVLTFIIIACPATTLFAGEKTPEFSTAGFHAIAGSPRKVYSFNPGWKFMKAKADGAERPDFDDSSWETVHLPHGLEILGENASGMRNYQGEACYRKVFSLPGRSSGKVTLYFEAVMGKAQVWLNGKLLCRHFGGYLPFAVDLTKDLVAGKNTVAVFADNSNDDSYPPGKEQDYLDFTYLGGIYRDVYLIETGATHISLPELSPTVAGGGVFVATKDVNGNRAMLEVRTEIRNDGKGGTFKVRTILEDAEKQALHVYDDRLSVASGREAQLVRNLHLPDVHLWHPNDPYLHYLRTELYRGNELIDSWRIRFGIRLLEMRGKDGFFVNKKYIGEKLSGVNRHQDYAYVGNATSNSSEWRDALLLREGGSNIVRAAHYPMDPAFMDACDEYGLLIALANPGWQFYNHANPLFRQRVLEDSRSMARRDRNRAAVILYETGLNETTDQPVDMLSEMHRIVHQENPFPGVFTCTDVDHAKAAGLDFYYHGAFHEAKNSLTREYGDGGEVDNFYSQNATPRVKREWGEKALLNQALIRARDLPGTYATPPIRIGATLWCGIDHQRGYHPDPFWGGLLDVYRYPRYSWHLFRSQYHPDFRLPGVQTGAMVYIAHEMTQESEKDVVVFTNCEEVRLICLGESAGVQKPDARYEGMPHPPVIFRDVFDFRTLKSKWGGRTGKVEMIAEGLINGVVACREVKQYAERTSGVKLAVDGQHIALLADGSDYIPVRATVVDNKGVPKVLASEYVRFEVEGPATIVGDAATNANPMKTQFGVATALIRATTVPGKIRIRAFCAGLEPDEIEIESRAPRLPLLYDAGYAQAAVATAAGERSTLPAGHPKPGGQELLKDLSRLQLELTAREQEIMELKSRLSQ
ncbi:MAG: glycoside hydrolase family 2 protein [Tannerella sp.]|jgi:beta-galactosidase|nr:glycoside hydrolase family 2 protein [Tannerella sp.]